MAEQHSITCERGTVLFAEGDVGDEVFVVQSGRIRMTRRVVNAQVAVEELSAGDFCGELALVMTTARLATATVVEEAQLLVVSAESFGEMLTSNPAVTSQMLKRLAVRLARAHFRLSNFALRTGRGRVLHQLRAEWQVARMESGDGLALVPDDLAAVLGMELGEVVHILEGARRDRLVSVDNAGVFTIPDQAAYDRLLSYLELQDRFEFASH
jgi:CRP-like cAMP-binding protein